MLSFSPPEELLLHQQPKRHPSPSLSAVSYSAHQGTRFSSLSLASYDRVDAFVYQYVILHAITFKIKSSSSHPFVPSRSPTPSLSLHKSDAELIRRQAVCIRWFLGDGWRGAQRQIVSVLRLTVISVCIRRNYLPICTLSYQNDQCPPSLYV